MPTEPDQATFVLEPTPVESRVDRNKAEAEAAEASLPEPLLIRNIAVFCRFRWIVVATLTVVGTIAVWPQAVNALRLRPGMYWPFVIAAVLLAENTAFLLHYQLLRRRSSGTGA